MLQQSRPTFLQKCRVALGQVCCHVEKDFWPFGGGRRYSLRERVEMGGAPNEGQPSKCGDEYMFEAHHPRPACVGGSPLKRGLRTQVWFGS